jgi:ketosteroid isomerase-like protein
MLDATLPAADTGWEMAQQKIDVRAMAEAAFGALNAGDLDGFLALIAEDVEFTSLVAEAEGATFRGHEGVHSWWDTVRGAFQDPQWELLDARGSPERAVTKFRIAGSLGGVPVSQTMWQAARAQDGKLKWWAFFRTEREAVEAVRLRE